MLRILLPAALALIAAAPPAQPAVYPDELLGSWHVGTEPCRLPDFADSDGLITIRRDGITGYESSISAYSIRRLATSPEAWRLDEFEDYEGETRRFTRTVVLSGRTLTSTEDGVATAYVRCTGSMPER